jgi:hypothetical protein
MSLIVVKMTVAPKIPSPDLTATFSPSDGERDGVRGLSVSWSFQLCRKP